MPVVAAVTAVAIVHKVTILPAYSTPRGNPGDRPTANGEPHNGRECAAAHPRTRALRDRNEVRNSHELQCFRVRGAALRVGIPFRYYSLFYFLHTLCVCATKW
jgi:hypothetical protein